MTEIPNSIPLPEMVSYGSGRIYAFDLSGEQQKWLIDRLGMEIELNLEIGPLRVRVKSVRDNKAILIPLEGA
jgi:hypothetical protein